jgi:uncharacterized protein DUF4238
VNIQLPSAIQWILGLIDQGSDTSTIILNILAVSPEYVQRHLADIALLRGTASPAVALLRDCVGEARRATSGQAPTVTVQHVISRALLGQFCEIVRPKSGPQLADWVLRSRKRYLRSSSAVGFVENFVKIDSAATEGRWTTVENRLRQATDAARAAGGLPPDPALCDVLRDAITLHLVRNPRTVTIHDRTFHEVFERNVDAHATGPLAEEAFRRHHGFLPAGDEGRKEGAKLLLEAIRAIYESGALFRFRVEAHFDRFRTQLRQHQLQVVVIPPGLGVEFLIGDAPVLAVAFDGTSIAPAALATATHVVLPLAPLVLAVLGPPALAARPAQDLIRHINRMEVLGAEDDIYHRPGQDFFRDIANWLNWNP